MNSVNYQFNPNDQLWYLDGTTVKVGKCLQTTIKLITDQQGLVTKIEYVVSIDCDTTTVIVQDADAYPSLNDALTALTTIINLPC